MRKGFTVTLLTVAIALLGSQAMAVAPTISDIRDIVISDELPVSGANHFTFPDAIALDTIADDEEATSPQDLTWSFQAQDGKYTINSVGPLTAGDSWISPPSGKVIAGPGSTNDDPDGTDGNIWTATFRNSDLSPIGGSDTAPSPDTPGIVASETRPITLWVSDGDKAASTTIMLYTDNDGFDRFSPDVLQPTEEINVDFTAGASNWVFVAGSGVTSNTNDGICLFAPGAGNNIGQWVSPFGEFNLVDNAVYQIRMGMSSTVSQPLQQPVWDLVILNSDQGAGAAPGAGAGTLTYGGDYYYIGRDDLSAVIGSQREFELYYMPPPALTAAWKSTTTGMFQAGIENQTGMSLSFRNFDVDFPILNTDNRTGTLCMQDIFVGRVDFDDLTRGPVVFDDPTIESADWAVSGANNTTYSGGVATITPNGANAWASSLETFVPAPGFGAPGSAGGNQADFESAFPVLWEDNKILLTEWSLSTSNPSAVQPTVIKISHEAANVAFFQEPFFLPNQPIAGGARPGALTGSAQTYVGFAHTMLAPQAGEADFNRIRPRLDLLNLQFLSDIYGVPTSPVRVHGITMTEVSL